MASSVASASWFLGLEEPAAQLIGVLLIAVIVLAVHIWPKPAEEDQDRWNW